LRTGFLAYNTKNRRRIKVINYQNHSQSRASSFQKESREKFRELFRETPIGLPELLPNLGLYLNRQAFSRMLFFNELYKKFVNVHGIIMEFGVRWGRDLALLANLRGIYEPYNFTRTIIGFDTFAGFLDIDEKDGTNPKIQSGAYSVTSEYKNYLERILEYHETESPLSHIKRFALIEGDAPITLKKYLDEHPETMIAFAYFDMDIYKPTKECLKLIKPYLTKGSIIGFDELNSDHFPGETVAVREVLGLDKYEIQRFPFDPTPSYIVID
jgi:hypothetical protein